MKLFGRRRSSGPPLEERLAAFRAERSGGHDQALLERRTEQALAESGLEWEGEQLADERKWKLATERGPVWIFSSVRDDAISLEQIVLHADELSPDDALVRDLLEGNAHTDGPHAAFGRASDDDPDYLVLSSLIPLEALSGDRLRSSLKAFLLRRGVLESGEQAKPTESLAERPDGTEEDRATARAAVEGLAEALELELEPERDEGYAWRLRTDLPHVALEIDVIHDVLRVTVPVEAADGVRSELRLFSYFLRSGGGSNSSFFAIVPHQRESWVAAMSTVPIAGLTPELVAFALEHPLDSAHYWRDPK